MKMALSLKESVQILNSFLWLQPWVDWVQPICGQEQDKVDVDNG